jgi:glycosyltransferase involved in cell wall biosynthesis
MNADAISVIVPVYNGANYLGEALECLLSQDCAPGEIIVVDDGSTDRTASIIAGYGARVHAIRQQNRGPAAARNAGIACASRQLIAFLDADDLWLPSTTIRFLEGLQINLAACMVWGLSDRLFMRDATTTGEEWYGRPQWALALGSMLIRRRLIDDIGGFDESLRAGEDMDFLVRIRERGTVLTRHAGIVHVRRIHGANQFTSDAEAMTIAHYRVIRKALERRRARKHALALGEK